MILFLFILLLCVPYAVVKGISDSLKWNKAEKDRIKALLELEQEEQERIEFEKLLLLDKLNGYNAQLESYSQTIEWLHKEEQKETDGLKAALLRKRQADIAIKAANIAEKAYNLQLKLEEMGEG